MVTALPTGELEFRVFAPSAHRVEVIGSFTQWERQPASMSPTGEGWWLFRAEIKPGDHEFFYRLDKWQRLPDYAAHGVRLDDTGRWISGLHIPAPDLGEPSLAA